MNIYQQGAPESDPLGAVINQEQPSLTVIISSGCHAQETEQRNEANASFIPKLYRRDELGQSLLEILTPILNV